MSNRWPVLGLHGGGEVVPAPPRSLPVVVGGSEWVLVPDDAGRFYFHHPLDAQSQWGVPAVLSAELCGWELAGDVWVQGRTGRLLPQGPEPNRLHTNVFAAALEGHLWFLHLYFHIAGGSLRVSTAFEGCTAMHYAAAGGRADVLDWVAARVSAEAWLWRNSVGETSLDLLARNGHGSALVRLAGQSAGLRAAGLASAARGGSLTVCRDLLGLWTADEGAERVSTVAAAVVAAQGAGQSGAAAYLQRSLTSSFHAAELISI